MLFELMAFILLIRIVILNLKQIQENFIKRKLSFYHIIFFKMYYFKIINKIIELMQTILRNI